MTRVKMIAIIEEVAIAEIPLRPYYLWPFGVALMAMIAFGFLGFKAGHPGLLWASGGAAGALAIATIASGLANAVAVPYIDAVRGRNQLIAFAVVVIIFILLGLLLAWRLRNYGPKSIQKGNPT
jgi:hypothetical protein